MCNLHSKASKINSKIQELQDKIVEITEHLFINDDVYIQLELSKTKQYLHQVMIEYNDVIDEINNNKDTNEY